MSHFEQVGPVVEYGDVEINREEAERFRQLAQLGTKIKELEVSDSQTRLITTSYATGVLSDAAGDYEVSESAFYTKSMYDSNPELWNSRITFARYNQRNADTKIYNIYVVESVQGQVLQATRRVHIIRNLSRLVIQNNEPSEEIYSRQYKAFEQPLVGDDIESIDRRMHQITARQGIMSRRR